jgi:hypothetical protein
MKIIATLAGVLAPVSAFATTGLVENDSGICVFMFLGYCALIVSAQFIPAILLLICMIKVIVSVVSESFAVQKN